MPLLSIVLAALYVHAAPTEPIALAGAAPQPNARILVAGDSAPKGLEASRQEASRAAMKAYLQGNYEEALAI